MDTDADGTCVAARLQVCVFLQEVLTLLFIILKYLVELSTFTDGVFTATADDHTEGDVKLSQLADYES